MRYQWLASPEYQALVAAPGATAAPAGENEPGDRLGRGVLQIWMTAHVGIGCLRRCLEIAHCVIIRNVLVGHSIKYAGGAQAGFLTRVK